MLSLVAQFKHKHFHNADIEYFIITFNILKDMSKKIYLIESQIKNIITERITSKIYHFTCKESE